MENKKVSIATVFLVIAIILIIVMGALLYMQKTEADRKIAELENNASKLQETINDLQGKIDTISNTINSNEEDDNKTNETTENNKEGIKYKGTWNTEYIYTLNGEDVDLGTILGTGYAQYGSKLILNEDGTFENRIEPIQSNEILNKGTWEYKDADVDVYGVGYVWGKIVLKYDDEREEELQLSTGRDSHAVLIYLLQNNYRLHLYR